LIHGLVAIALEPTAAGFSIDLTSGKLI
jgi:hypothetical protein